MGYVFIGWLIILVALVTVYRHQLVSNWREPVLRVPVLILESDDWGAGPEEQAVALRRLAKLLGSVKDADGRPAMMTLGIVLAIMDRKVWRKDKEYAVLHLGTNEHAEILNAIHDGMAAGVFAPQLHGMEHYWPSALIRRSTTDAMVSQWISDERAITESLPDAIQTRWVDASTLPSRALPVAEIRRAVEEETNLFRTLFGESARVAVPNTFVWNDDVERAWKERGVRYVITPGTRYEERGADGALITSGRSICNGAIAPTGVCYLVRDVYFEPVRGHEPERFVQGVVERTRLGRPCLIETHRANYLGAEAGQSYRVLSAALEAVVRESPEVRFMSSEDLGDAIVGRDPRIIEARISERYACWVERVLTSSPFRKLAWVIGLALLMRGSRSLLLRLTNRMSAG